MLLFFIVLSVALSIPAVQTSLGKRATNYLNNRYNTNIKINKIDLSYLGSIQLKNVEIDDHHNDTLIYVNRLTTSIFSYRKIINNKLQFGRIDLQEVYFNIKTYKGEDNDALSIFVEKFEDKNDTITKPSTFLLTSSKLNLENGQIKILDENQLIPKAVTFVNTSGTINNFKIKGPKVWGNLNDFAFIENHQIEITDLDTDFVYTKQKMEFLNTSLQTETSQLKGDIVFNYDREDFRDFNNLVKLNADIKEADISLIDLNKFYNELGVSDVIHLKTELSGTLNDLKATNLYVTSDQKSIIKGNLHFKNVFNQENGFSLNADITQLTSNYNHLQNLLPNILGNTLPTSFKKLGQFTLRGKSYITTKSIVAKLHVNSLLGSVDSDLKLTNIDNIDKASYVGHVIFNDFKLGEFIENDKIGLLSLDADVKGAGFDLESVNTIVKGFVTKYQYNNYTYSNIELDGELKNKKFNGSLISNDENLKLHFDGLADLSSAIYNFNFKADVDYANFNKLNLFKRDSIAILKGDINIDMSGNSIENIVGTVIIKKASYTNQNDNYYFEDFNIKSTIIDSVRTVEINSTDIINGKLDGKFNFDELDKLARNSIGSVYTNFNPFEVTANQYLDFNFKVYNKIVEVFYPGIKLSPNTFIKGSIDSDKNEFKLTLRSPQLDVFNSIVKDIRLQVDNKNPLFNTQLSISKINSKIYDISDFNLVNVTLNDTLFFRTEFNGGKLDTENYNLSFYHTINEANKSVIGIQKSNFEFKDTNWLINNLDNNENKIVFDNKFNNFNFESFDIISGKQKINFEGFINKDNTKDLSFTFKDVDLKNITPNIDNLSLDGIVNGTIGYLQDQETVKPSATIKVNKLYVNKLHQGDLGLSILGKNSLKEYDVNISLNRNKALSLVANGVIDFSSKKPTLDIDVNLEEFKLDMFSSLGEDVISNIRGNAYGDIKLTGLLEDPTMEGSLFLDQAGLYFPFLNIDYDFEGTTVVELKNQTFDIQDLTLYDKVHRTRGNLTGTISHQKFDKWFLDLDVNTKNLLVLNTELKENTLYYGKAFIEGNAAIKGYTDDLAINVNGKTKKGTYFIIPLSDVKTINNTKLIRFISNKDQIALQDKSLQEILKERFKGLNLNFNLEVTKDAVVEMVLDQSTGSYLKGSGTGNLQIEIDTKDKFTMFGDFIVDNGIYNFKYGGIINKPFKVNKGGSISWSGDPYTANINIEAVYRVNANPKVLLENITTTRKIPVDLITRFSGELFNSNTEFDLVIPNSSSVVDSELNFKLNSNDDKLLQFMSLLTTGSFYNVNDLSVNRASAIGNTTSELISNVLSDIFNNDDNKVKFGIDYTVGDNNKIDNLDIDDQIGLSVESQLNDKILINGKVGVPVGSKRQTSVIGEVKVDYLLNEEGTFRFTAFNRQNEIQFAAEEEEGYTQGVGFSYQVDFNNLSDLLVNLKLKKDVNKDSINLIEKKIDTIKKNKLIKFIKKTPQ